MNLAIVFNILLVIIILLLVMRVCIPGESFDNFKKKQHMKLHRPIKNHMVRQELTMDMLDHESSGGIAAMCHPNTPDHDILTN